MTSLPAHHHLAVALSVFLVAAALIAVFGVRMTHLARDLAVAIRLGEAVVGAVLIGATTSPISSGLWCFLLRSEDSVGDPQSQLWRPPRG